MTAMTSRLDKLERRVLPVDMPTLVIQFVAPGERPSETHSALVWNRDTGQYDTLTGEELEERFGNCN